MSRGSGRGGRACSVTALGCPTGTGASSPGRRLRAGGTRSVSRRGAHPRPRAEGQQDRPCVAGRWPSPVVGVREAGARSVTGRRTRRLWRVTGRRGAARRHSGARARGAARGRGRRQGERSPSPRPPRLALGVHLGARCSSAPWPTRRRRSPSARLPSRSGCGRAKASVPSPLPFGSSGLLFGCANLAQAATDSRTLAAVLFLDFLPLWAVLVGVVDLRRVGLNGVVSHVVVLSRVLGPPVPAGSKVQGLG